LTIAEARRNGGPRARAGTRTLSLLAHPLNVALIRTLAEAPTSLADLRQAVDSPPQTTMRSYLRILGRTGVVERRRRNDFPGNVEFELTPAGRELLAVAELLSAWLASFPGTPTTLGSGAAKSAVNALVEGWSTSMVRALASRPLSLTELDSIIAAVSYPSLERRLAAMREAGLVKPLASHARGTPYGVTEWLRGAVAPLTAAARWERGRPEVAAPEISGRDVEAALLLALPILRLPAQLSGSCRLGVRVSDPPTAAMAGAVATARAGEVVGCTTTLEDAADGWVVGSVLGWFGAVFDDDPRHLEVGGRGDLPRAVIAALQRPLATRGAAPVSGG
jgi:DNA-binding HxlR family transcriptional regulator